METSPNKITHAVPLEVQRVLDAMTEENWAQNEQVWEDGRACFMNRAAIMHGFDCYAYAGPIEWLDEGLYFKVRNRYGMNVARLNDTAASLSDFKSKIIALYQEQP